MMLAKVRRVPLSRESHGTDITRLDERNFRRFLASDMPENSVAVIDLPAPPPTRSIDPRFLVAITLVLGGSMIVALAQALRRR